MASDNAESVITVPLETPLETPQPLSFVGRTAVVTGGAQGIGRAVVHRLATLGASVALWDIDGAQAAQTAETISASLASGPEPGSVIARRVDVTDVAEIKEGLAAFCPEGLDVLVNNAGTTSLALVDDMASDTWDRTLRLNLTGTFVCIQAALPYLRRRPAPAIVNVSSSAALVGGGGGAHYAASKAGVDGLTRHLAQELAPTIRVNAVQPRTIDTGLFRKRYAHAPDDVAALLRQIPLNRVGRPMEIADVVAFLASDWSSYLTGQLILVDGGRTFR
jgi:NAD(P)-dependent dehydrogenase (short-subunit alcohol dehydrogenase family)